MVHLIKADVKWKTTTVVFSGELTAFYPIAFILPAKAILSS